MISIKTYLTSTERDEASERTRQKGNFQRERKSGQTACEIHAKNDAHVQVAQKSRQWTRHTHRTNRQFTT